MVQGEPQVADVWCRDWRVVDRKGLPMRCLHASRPKKSRRRGGTKSLHFAPKSSFWRKTGRRRGARAGSARAPGDGSFFLD